jgi:5-oxoprolinase (ATP-hydrolysing)
MDDGSPIALTVKIDRSTGDATFDFTGTGPEVRGNWNAPISVVHSAIIYWSVQSFFLRHSRSMSC